MGQVTAADRKMVDGALAVLYFTSSAVSAVGVYRAWSQGVAPLTAALMLWASGVLFGLALMFVMEFLRPIE